MDVARVLSWKNFLNSKWNGRRRTWGGNQAADICIGAPMAIGPPIALMIDPERNISNHLLGISTCMAAEGEWGLKGRKEERQASEGRPHHHTKGGKNLDSGGRKKTGFVTTESLRLFLRSRAEGKKKRGKSRVPQRVKRVRVESVQPNTWINFTRTSKSKM